MRGVSEPLQILSLETEMTDCPTLSLQCRIQIEEIRGRGEGRGGGGAVIQILRKGEKGGPGQRKFFFRPFGPQFGLKMGGGLPWIRHCSHCIDPKPPRIYY